MLPSHSPKEGNIKDSNGFLCLFLSVCCALLTLCLFTMCRSNAISGSSQSSVSRTFSSESTYPSIRPSLPPIYPEIACQNPLFFLHHPRANGFARARAETDATRRPAIPLFQTESRFTDLDLSLFVSTGTKIPASKAFLSARGRSRFIL